jgi:hypothetical protein
VGLVSLLLVSPLEDVFEGLNFDIFKLEVMLLVADLGFKVNDLGEVLSPLYIIFFQIAHLLLKALP